MSETEFIEAAKSGDTATVLSLLDVDPELVSAAGDHDKTALHWAAEMDDSVTAAVLLDAGADIEARTDWGATPLEWAAVMGSEQVADLLLGRGARGYNIVTAAGLGKISDVQTLTESATQPNGEPNAEPVANEMVSQALHLAARNGHVETVAYLLGQGGDIDAKGFFGATGLHWAAMGGHKEMVDFLVEHGADLTLKDDEFNATPEGWAEEGGFNSIAEYLHKHSSDSSNAN
ncbi:MAG TPA: ankyrin repeat domain-containing protein [Pyrinomonadaceae bacterium]|jgi:ankyrin repeat protein|nr:ankyrin repeat domain-containing protein [Pyrinomonadaceae bacterium]